MKKTRYYISINIKTAAGFESIGKFFIGDNREFSYTLFSSLQGDTAVDDKSMLTMELFETFNELPLNLKMISCSLSQLAENCALITKSTFKAINIEDL